MERLNGTRRDDIGEAVERIRRMERCFDALRENPDPAGLAVLTQYYESGRWLRDYELDEQGLLPPDLKRGVLSQDGVWDLLSGSPQFHNREEIHEY